MFNVPLILKKLDLKPGDIVADLGTGREGRMAISAAQFIGDDGIAYAVDVVKAILPGIQTKAAMYGLNNVHTVWSNLEVYGGAKVIADNSCDAVFLVTVLFQSQKHLEILKEAIRVLKPKGKMVVVDWKVKTEATFGPALSVRINPEGIKKLAVELGLKLQEEFEAGQCHWGLIFVK